MECAHGMERFAALACQGVEHRAAAVDFRDSVDAFVFKLIGFGVNF